MRVPGKETEQEPRALRAGAIAVHTEEGLPRAWWIPPKSAGFTSQKLHCALEVLGTNLPLLTWNLRKLQPASNLPKR